MKPYDKEYYTEAKKMEMVPFFCVSAIRHDSLLSKYRKQKQSPPGYALALITFGTTGLKLKILIQ
jgi:hypothetical protein